MRNFDVHVCLVSKQPLPNLIPILAWLKRQVTHVLCTMHTVVSS